LNAQADETPQDPDAVASDWGVFVRTTGAARQWFALDAGQLASAEGIVLGRRESSCHIVVSDPSISRSHCRLRGAAEGLSILDLQSRNGTFVNERRLAAYESEDIRPDDRIEIGSVVIELVAGESAPGPARETAEVPTVEPPDDAADGSAADQDEEIVEVSEIDEGTTVETETPDPAQSGRRADVTPSPAKAGAGLSASWEILGKILIAASVVAAALALTLGGHQASTAAAQFLSALVFLAIATQAVAAGLDAWRRQAAVNNLREVELDKLRQEIRLTAENARLAKEKAAASWVGVRKYRVEHKEDEGGGICSFYLVPHDGKPNPPFEPGQYLTFHLRIPDQEKQIVRCYSLSDGPAAAERYRVSVKRLAPPPGNPEAPPGLVSNYFHDHVNEGDILDVKSPSGKFFLDQTRHSPVVLIGGGVGLTPVLSMLNAIAASGSTRETWFFYGVRNGDDHVMRDHLECVASDHENVRLHVCYSDPRDGIDRPGDDYHHGERVSVELFKRLLPSNNYDFYVCGPPPMMESIVHDLSSWGVPDDHVHFETFGPASVKKTKSAPPASTTADKAPATVTFSKSGKSIPWSDQHEAILELAEANGVVMDSGCRAGNCGSCLTAVKAGRVRYLEEPGAQPDEGTCLTCISVPDGDIVLEA